MQMCLETKEVQWVYQHGCWFTEQPTEYVSKLDANLGANHDCSDPSLLHVIADVSLPSFLVIPLLSAIKQKYKTIKVAINHTHDTFSPEKVANMLEMCYTSSRHKATLALIWSHFVDKYESPIFTLCLGLHRLLRNITTSLATKCSAMFTS